MLHFLPALLLLLIQSSADAGSPYAGGHRLWGSAPLARAIEHRISPAELRLVVQWLQDQAPEAQAPVEAEASPAFPDLQQTPAAPAACTFRLRDGPSA